MTWGNSLRGFLAALAAMAARHHWVSFALVALIGVVDFATGPELLFGILYLLPVVIIAWWHNERRVATIAIMAALTWLIVDIFGGRAYSNPLIPFWNAVTRLGIFWIVGFVTYHARTLQTKQSDLINYIVHDLRSPLTILTSGLDLIATGGSRDAAEGMEHCHVATARLETLIDSILDLGRLEAGAMPLNIQDVAVGNVVDAVIREAAVFAKIKGIRLRKEIGTGVEAVRADRAIFYRILVNLLTNAVKASPENSSVRLRVESSGPDTVVLAVIDSGPGIPREYVSRIFDKFAQIQLRDSGTVTGFGLGLAFCRHAVIAQHGRIWIENIADGGTAVLVALPAAKGK